MCNGRVHSLAFFHPVYGPLLDPGSHVFTFSSLLFSSLMHICAYVHISLCVCIFMHVFIYITACVFIVIYITIGILSGDIGT